MKVRSVKKQQPKTNETLTTCLMSEGRILARAFQVGHDGRHIRAEGPQDQLLGLQSLINVHLIQNLPTRLSRLLRLCGEKKDSRIHGGLAPFSEWTKVGMLHVEPKCTILESLLLKQLASATLFHY